MSLGRVKMRIKAHRVQRTGGHITLALENNTVSFYCLTENLFLSKCDGLEINTNVEMY